MYLIVPDRPDLFLGFASWLPPFSDIVLPFPIEV